MENFSLLKKFCLRENLFVSKTTRDTNNGEFLCLEVRWLEQRGHGVLFTKTKWFPKNTISREKVLNLLSYQFFKSFGIPIVSESYWTGAPAPVPKSQPQPKIQKRVKRQPAQNLQSSFDAELDQILDGAIEDYKEEGATVEDSRLADGVPPVHNFMDMMNLAGQIPDQSFQGMMSAFSTPGGLAQVGNLLQNPAVLGLLSPIMTSMMQAIPKPPGSMPKDDEEQTDHPSKDGQPLVQPLDSTDLPEAEEV